MRYFTFYLASLLYLLLSCTALFAETTPPASTTQPKATETNGLPVNRPNLMPPQPDGIWQSPYGSDAWVPSIGDDKHRWAMYTYWKRTSPYPSMITFDSPSREFCQVRRIRTNTPLQALVTLNDPVYVEAASRLAAFMAGKATTPDARIQAGFRRVMGRPIEPRKLAVLTRLYWQTEAFYQQHPADAKKLLASPTATPTLAALTVTANTMLIDEVITKE